MHLSGARRIVIFAGLAIIVLMGLFPPWTFTFTSQGIYSEEPGGYFSIVSPPTKKEDSPRHGVKIDMSRLIVQCAITVSAAGLGLLVTGRRIVKNDS